ncbi:MAG: hypothetical protein V4686_04020 [Patescibacteria group bacterium]
MQTTIFFVQLWGPILLAIGLGIFISRKYYIRLYRDLEKNSLAVLGLGIAFMAVGIIQTAVHNVWRTLPQIVISILGWGTLIKGILFLVIPGVVDKTGDWEVKSKLIPLAGSVMIVLGLYLTWLGYFVAF